MASEELDIRKAIADVELIRRVLNQAENQPVEAPHVDLLGVTVTANLVIQTVAVALAGALLLTEALGQRYLSRLLELGATAPDLRLLGVALIAGLLVGLVILLYLVIWRAARNSGEDFNQYLVRNFRYARLLSYLSDLFIKFVAVSLLILGGHTAWIGPLLLVFTGDYLIQGRLFTLSTRVAIGLGAFCIVAGLVQFFMGVVSLLPALVFFTAIGAASMGRLIRIRKATD
ncbi:MAG: hypothetical protein ACO3RT_12155 [Arenicellales bacterium]|jgi:hypothetical protein|nr:hypothetical protein [Gammaproteobacteria bacterium]NDA15478.1 hypothetical protein [Gammaproteobacteria bacterium]NDG45295.1 hypothetical protein [Gammaproteobacteria bacterium]